MFTIRKATLKDLPALVKLGAVFKKERLTFLPPFLRVFDYNMPRASFEKYIRGRNRNVLVAAEGPKIIGYAANVVAKTQGLKKTFPQAKIADLFVLKAYRGRGVAGALYRTSVKWFKKRKCKYLQIFVYSKNPAQEIYQRWGFTDFVLNVKKKI